MGDENTTSIRSVRLFQVFADGATKGRFDLVQSTVHFSVRDGRPATILAFKDSLLAPCSPVATLTPTPEFAASHEGSHNGPMWRRVSGTQTERGFLARPLPPELEDSSHLSQMFFTQQDRMGKKGLENDATPTTARTAASRSTRRRPAVDERQQVVVSKTPEKRRIDFEAHSISRESSMAESMSAPPPVSMFSTGSGKAINGPSHGSYLRAMQLLGESEAATCGVPGRSHPVFDTVSEKSGCLHDTTERPALQSSMASMEPMFTTALGKTVAPPSCESVLKAQKVLESSGTFSVQTELSGCKDSPAAMFSTASGKHVQPPTADALHRARRLMTPDSFQSLSPIASMGGAPSLFTTASGRTVSGASADSLSRAQRLLQGAGTDAAGSPMAAHVARSHSGPSSKERRQFTVPSTPEGRFPRQRRFITPRPSKPLHCAAWKSPLSGDGGQQESRSAGMSPPSKRRRPPIGSPIPMQPLTAGSESLHSLFKEQGNRIPLDMFHPHPPSFSHLSSVPHEVRHMNAQTASHFVLGGVDGMADLRALLLDAGADPRQASLRWVANHYRWIVWKLASYERGYSEWAGKLLTRERVLDQLRYRYQREVNEGQRSALRRVIERDASSALCMTLCVAAMLPSLHEGDPATAASSDSATFIEVTDGWYSIRARLDGVLSHLTRQGKIFVGQKLQVQGAILEGSSEGVHPLEAPSSTALLLPANGTRRAPWCHKLGFCRPSPLSLSCVKELGGHVPLTLVQICRRYPLLHMERLPDGKSIVRSQRCEDQAQQHFLQRQEAVAEEVGHKFGEEWPGSDDVAALPSLSCARRIVDAMGASEDPGTFFSSLSLAERSQVERLQSHRQKEYSAGLERATRSALEDAGVAQRDVSVMLKLRVAGLHCRKKDLDGREAVITIWQPADDMLDQLQEGSSWLVSSLQPHSKYRNGAAHVLQLNATRASRWRVVPPSCLTHCRSMYMPRRVIPLCDLHSVREQGEFDTAAMVVHVGQPLRQSFRMVQWLFVVDGSCGPAAGASGSGAAHWALLAIHFSASMDSFLALEPGLLGLQVLCRNLIKTKYDYSNHLYTCEASDCSTISQSQNGAPLCSLSEEDRSLLGERIDDVLNRALGG